MIAYRQRFLPLRYSTLLVGCAFLLTLAGCKAQQANIKVKKAKEQIEQAKKFEAEKYAPEDYRQAQESVDSATRQLSAGDNAEALQSSKQALEAAERALSNSQSRYATDQSTQAQKALETAELNQGETEDPTRFQKIRETYNQISTARTQGEFSKVIELSNTVLSEVDLLLKRLKNEADRHLIEANNQLSSLKAEGGQEYAPEKVIEVTDLVNQVEGLINTEENFIAARNQANLAVQKANEGILSTKREKCKEKINDLERLMVLAIEEGAELYAKASLDTVKNQYDDLTANFQNNQFDRALLSADTLKPKVEALVLTTKRNAANTRIKELRQATGDLIEAGVEEYLPGRIDPLQKTLARATELYDSGTEDAYDKIKQLTQDSVREEQKIRDKFKERALKSIREARDELQKGKAIFAKMEGIFITQPDAKLPSLDRRFEDIKQTRKTDISEGLESANRNLSVAAQRERDNQWKSAIVLAEETQTSIQEMIGQIYEVVAQNAVIELSALVSQYETVGAIEYAPDQLAQTKASLQESQALIQAKQHWDAVQKAAEARASLELTLQQITEQANRIIGDAKEEIEASRTEETLRFRSNDLRSAEELVTQADRSFEAKQMKNAAQLAEEAIAKAQKAVNEAQGLAALEKVQEARKQFEAAKKVDAFRYAGEDYDDAEQLVMAAETHHRQGDFASAMKIAEDAKEKSENTLFKLVHGAEATIGEAKSAGGWRMDHENLAEAIVKSEEARRLLEKGSHLESERLAAEARHEASSVANDAKLTNFHKQASRIRKNLDEGLREGITLFQADEAVAIQQELVRVNDHLDRVHLENYAETMDSLNSLEGRLRAIIDSTEPKYRELVEAQQTQLDQLAEAGADDYAAPLIAKARFNLKHSQIDFNKERFRPAYLQLTEAIAQVEEIQTRQNQERYVWELRSLFGMLKAAERKFTNVTSQNPRMMKHMTGGDNGRGQAVSIASGFTPKEFLEEVEKVHAQALLLQPPQPQAKIHQDVLQAINEERMAARSFEKLVILDQLSQSEANRLIDQSYSLLDSARRRIAEIQRQLTFDEENFRQTSNSINFFAPY